MWQCEGCLSEFAIPKWGLKEWKGSFYEYPYCPVCGSETVEECEDFKEEAA